MSSLKFSFKMKVWLTLIVINFAVIRCEDVSMDAAAEETELMSSTSSNISKRCRKDFILFERMSSGPSVLNATWAHYMLDAYGGVSSGVVQSNFYMLGDFEECVGIEVAESSTNSTSFYGQFCFVTLTPKTSSRHKFQLGTCSPSTCSSHDLQLLFRNTYLDSVYNITVDEHFCQTKFKRDLDNVDIGICAMVLIILCMSVVGTIFGFYAENRQPKNSIEKVSAWKVLLLGFSAKINSKNVFGNLENSKDLSVLHGLRAISMSYVVIGHTYYLTLLNMSSKNSAITLQLINRKYASQMLITSEYAVDSFLFISGFLTSYGLLAKMHAGKKFNYLWHLIHRVIRLSPAYLFIIAIMAGPYDIFFRGPMIPALKIDQNACRQQWWTHALFINIYIHQDQDCLPQTWYLCLDWVYYALYPLILYPLYKKAIAGYVIYGLFLLASLLVPGILIYVGDLEPLPLLENTYYERKAYNEQIYEKPWGRMVAGLVGLAFGYLALVKNKGIKMNLIFVSLTWILVTATGLLLAYGCHHYYADGTRMPIPLNVFYGTFSRPTWCLLLGWIIIACSNGYGSVIHRVLSWKAFVPISRLSFATYLTHFLVIGLFFGGIKDLLYYDEAMMGYMTFSIFILSVILAYILNITVEQPFTNLEKLIFH